MTALYVWYDYDKITGFSCGRNLHEVRLKSYSSDTYDDWPMDFYKPAEAVPICSDDELFVIIGARSGRKGSACPVFKANSGDDEWPIPGPTWYHIFDNVGDRRGEMRGGFLLRPGEICGTSCSFEGRSCSHSHVWVGWDGHSRATVLEWPKMPPKKISDWRPLEFVKLEIETLQIDLAYYQRKFDAHPDYGGYKTGLEDTQKAIANLEARVVVPELNVLYHHQPPI